MFPLTDHPGKLSTQSQRMVVAFWSMFCLILTAIYTGNLVAFLSVEKLVLPFNTFRQMSLDPSYKIGTLGGAALVSAIEVSVLS